MTCVTDIVAQQNVESFWVGVGNLHTCSSLFKKQFSQGKGTHKVLEQKRIGHDGGCKELRVEDSAATRIAREDEWGTKKKNAEEYREQEELKQTLFLQCEIVG